MFTTLLKSKIHRVRVTKADRHYEGSISIDSGLMKAANLVTHEHVHIWNVTRGARFETYVIPAPQGSGTVQINGAAAHHAKKGDLVIVSSFAHIPSARARRHRPTIVLVDPKNNRIKSIHHKSGHSDPLPVL